jgi:hypothetical protein
MFDNPRFAGEKNQPGQRPSIPDITPVTDMAAGVEFGFAADMLNAGLDLKDEVTKERLRNEFASLELEETGSPGEKRNFTKELVEARQAKDYDALNRINEDLVRFKQAESQGGATARKNLQIKQKLMLRKAIDDNPWMASEIRSLAATYSVSGMGGTGRGTSGTPDEDAAFAMQEKMAEAIHMNYLFGLNPDDPRAEANVRAQRSLVEGMAIKLPRRI